MKYDSQDRSDRYVLTLLNTSDGVEAYNFIGHTARKVLPGKGGVIRYGRHPERKKHGFSRVSAVPVGSANRWDVYLNRKNSFSTSHRDETQTLIIALVNAGFFIKFVNAIHQVGIAWKKTIELSEQTPKQTITKPENLIEVPKPMNKTTTWDVTLECRIKVPGDSVSALEKHLESLGFDEHNLVKYEQVDQHPDLPLVRFTYFKPDFVGAPTNHSICRIRLTKVTDEYVEGFENGQFKKFRQDRVIAGPTVESFDPNAE